MTHSFYSIEELILQGSDRLKLVSGLYICVECIMCQEIKWKNVWSQRPYVLIFPGRIFLKARLDVYLDIIRIHCFVIWWWCM